MRTINEKGYHKTGQLYSKNFDTGEYETIPKIFKCKELQTTHNSTNHIHMMTDTTTKYETLSDYTFQVGDKVALNGSTGEILNIEYVPYKEIGSIRKIERYKKVITLP